MSILVGTSGWTYPRWRGDFYPDGLVHRRELTYLAERTTSVELNGSFYSLQRPSSYARWRDETPADFVFAVKGSRYMTTMKRLIGIETAMANFWASGVLALGPKLGPVLWQLPKPMTFDATTLAAFFDLLPRSMSAAAELAKGHDDKVPQDRALVTPEDGCAQLPIRHVLEPRNVSFASAEAVDLLRDNGIGMVLSDSPDSWPLFDEDTSDVRYVRLHGHTDLYASGYDAPALDAWAARCRGWEAAGRDVFVYFDNDARGRAPWDAVSLVQRLGG